MTGSQFVRFGELLRQEVTRLDAAIAGLRTDVTALQVEVAGVRGELTGLRHEMHAGSEGLGKEVRGELGQIRAEFGQLRSELRADLANQRAELLKWMFLFWAGTVMPLAGLMVALNTR